MRILQTVAVALTLILAIGPIGGAQRTTIPTELRAATFAPAATTLQTALELKRAGWIYVMPVPKSPQAAWGNRDGRTTWYVGYWTNMKTQATSTRQPFKDTAGKWTGDGKGEAGWRNGGSPPTPTQIEWLCSTSGGVSPR